MMQILKLLPAFLADAETSWKPDNGSMPVDMASRR